MPNEAKTLTAARVRKETALCKLREYQLAQLDGRLLDAADVEATWAAQLMRIRDAVLQIPSRCALKFADPRHAEATIRAECEIALRSLAGASRG